MGDVSLEKAVSQVESDVLEKVRLALSKELKTAESYACLANVMQVSERTVRRIIKGERDITLKEYVRHLESKSANVREALLDVLEQDTGQKTDVKNRKKPAQAVVAPALGFTWREWMLGHMKLRMKVGYKAVKPDKWRLIRDHVLFGAVCLNAFIVAMAWLGLPLGTLTGPVGLVLVVSISVTLMLGYAFFEDLGRGRYYLGWTSEE